MDIKIEPEDPREDELDEPDLLDPKNVGNLIQEFQTQNNIQEKKTDTLECSVCGEKFNNEITFKIHEMYHSDIPFCTYCKRTIVRGNFHEHLDKVHLNKICPICAKVFSDNQRLKCHSFTHDPKFYKCGRCGKTFSLKMELNNHGRLCPKIGDSEELRCDVCSEKFTSEVALLVHEMFHNKNNHCFVCNRVFTKDFHKHIRKMHMNHICPLCDKHFTLKKSLQMHIRSHTKERIFKCDQCSKSFMQRGALNYHYWTTHEKGGRFYICEICNGEYSGSSSLKRHKRKMHVNVGDKIHVCNICQEKFSDKKMVYDHKKKHLISKQCEVCGTRFNTTERLIKHLTQYHFQTEQCPHCDKMYHKSKVKYHMQAHRPQRCPVCQQVFYTSRNLRTHMASHPTERVKCEKCDVYILGTLMEEHVQKHEENKIKHFCYWCPKEFGSVQEKDRHMQKAHYRAPGHYNCKICNKQFSYKPLLASHLRNNHDVSLRYKCRVCKRIFNELSQFKRHRNVHKKAIGFADYRYSCKKCGKRFNHKASLEGHLRQLRKHKCHICQGKYPNTESFRKHLIEFHSPRVVNDVSELEKLINTSTRQSSTKKVRCKNCCSILDHLPSSRKHFCKISSNVGHRCHLCNRRFKLKKGLAEHLRNGHLARKVKCTMCEFEAFDLRGLRKHVVRFHFMRRDLTKSPVQTRNTASDVIDIKLGHPDVKIEIEEYKIKNVFIKSEAFDDE